MPIASLGSQEGTQQPALEESSAVSLGDRSLKADARILFFKFLFYFKYSQTIYFILNITANKNGDSV